VLCRDNQLRTRYHCDDRGKVFRHASRGT
jgi:hypothetical protein